MYILLLLSLIHLGYIFIKNGHASLLEYYLLRIFHIFVKEVQPQHIVLVDQSIKTSLQQPDIQLPRDGAGKLFEISRGLWIQIGMEEHSLLHRR
ncbi:hypothetical protein D3C77_210880 [compost metagenome]